MCEYIGEWHLCLQRTPGNGNVFHGQNGHCVTLLDTMFYKATHQGIEKTNKCLPMFSLTLKERWASAAIKSVSKKATWQSVGTPTHPLGDANIFSLQLQISHHCPSWSGRQTFIVGVPYPHIQLRTIYSSTQETPAHFLWGSHECDTACVQDECIPALGCGQW